MSEMVSTAQDIEQLVQASLRQTPYIWIDMRDEHYPHLAWNIVPLTIENGILTAYNVDSGNVFTVPLDNIMHAMRVVQPRWYPGGKLIPGY